MLIYRSKNTNRLVVIWLVAMCVTIILMIFIGGLTRLTRSGLSITEWNPVSGILPPFNQYQWEAEFAKYKQSPEYIRYNSQMSLQEFKPIYYLEFYHRIAGRFITLLYLIPLICFIIHKKIYLKNIRIYILGLLLLACQGLMGWYMVKSGLVSEPHVSHYRLSAHLMLAVILYIILFWQLLSNTFRSIVILTTSKSIYYLKILGVFIITLHLIQMIFGAFTAGLNAGLIYNTFPYMGGSLIPSEILNSKFSIDCLSKPVIVQFIHRVLGYTLVIVISIYCFFLSKLKYRVFAMSIRYMLIAITIQIIGGIFTIIYMVPILLALIHQVGSIFLLSSLLWCYFLLSRTALKCSH